MWLALGLFAAGWAEYGLAAYWTRALVTKDVGRTAAATFVNVMLWGFVVANLKLGDPALLVVHGLGCSLGAAAMCWWAKREEATVRRSRRAARRKSLRQPAEAITMTA
jgi:hypothetical protein